MNENLTLRILLPTCRDVSRLQSQALDQSISLPKRIGLGLHLLLCKWCRRYGRQIRFLRRVVGEHPEPLAQAAPEVLPAGSRARLKQRLRDEAE